MASGMHNVSGEWMRFAQNRLEENLKKFDELMSCRSLPDCMAVQTRMVRDNFEAFLQTARRTSELSTKLADDAVKQMSDAVPR
jgi:phasin family protein